MSEWMGVAMFDDQIHILVSFDKNYIGPFKTMLKSLVINNFPICIHVWLLHSTIPEDSLCEIAQYCASLQVDFTPTVVDRSLFANAPVMKQYPQEMYYRLLAPLVLPSELKRVLYLDPDILVINSIRPLWGLDMEGHTFAAACHNVTADLVNDVNRFRLDTEHDYYNTGIMLMDLEKAREVVRPEEVFSFVQGHAMELLLPDQDVFNGLYGKFTLSLDDRIWNYDARYYHGYLLKSEGQCDVDWVMENTAILHFCGKKKPWHPSYTHRFGVLYKHYQNMAKSKKLVKEV